MDFTMRRLCCSLTMAIILSGCGWLPWKKDPETDRQWGKCQPPAQLPDAIRKQVSEAALASPPAPPSASFAEEFSIHWQEMLDDLDRVFNEADRPSSPPNSAPGGPTSKAM